MMRSRVAGWMGVVTTLARLSRRATDDAGLPTLGWDCCRVSWVVKKRSPLDAERQVNTNRFRVEPGCLSHGRHVVVVVAVVVGMAVAVGAVDLTVAPGADVADALGDAVASTARESEAGLVREDPVLDNGRLPGSNSVDPDGVAG